MGGAARFDDISDFRRHGMHMQLECGNSRCGHVGIVDPYDAERWFRAHRWPLMFEGFGYSAFQHFYCSKCRAKAGRARPTMSNPTVTTFFPADEQGWAMLIRRLRG